MRAAPVVAGLLLSTLVALPSAAQADGGVAPSSRFGSDVPYIAKIRDRNPGAIFRHDVYVVSAGRRTVVCTACAAGAEILLERTGRGQAFELQFVIHQTDGVVRTVSSRDPASVSVTSMENDGRWLFDLEDSGVPPIDLTVVVAEANALWGGAPVAMVGEKLSKGCTTGVAVTDNATGQLFMASAKHCLRLQLPVNAPYLPIRRHVDIYRSTAGSDRSIDFGSPLVRDLTCLDRDRADCLLPTGLGDDFFAFATGPDVLVSTLVQTGDGLRPSLGAGDWKHGEFVCRWGSSTNSEQCGTVTGYDKSMTAVRMKGGLSGPGDSGGPVYRKVTAEDGSPAVVVVGLHVSGSPDKDITYFEPVRSIEADLGVRTAVTP